MTTQPATGTTMRGISAASSTECIADWLCPHPGFGGAAPIDRLYDRLEGMYLRRWRSLFTDGRAVENWRQAWAEGLAAERLTVNEIRRGLAACRRVFDWPPTLAEFIRACRPQIDYERAFLEAVEQMRKRDIGIDEWSDPAVYWAAVKLGSDLSSNPYQSIKTRWRAALDAAIEDVRNGKLPDSVPPRRNALPAPSRCSVPPDEAKRVVASIRDMLDGVRNGTSG